MGTPGGDSVVKGNLDSTVVDGTFLISADLVWGLRGITPGEGPIVVGLAHSDYSAAEIEEALEAITSWDEGDKVAQERRRRKVRTVGMFSGETATQVLNDGKPIKTKLGFAIAEGDTLAVWGWNKSGATLTTGQIITAQGGVNARLI